MTGLARRDRLAVTGRVSDVATVVHTLLGEPGPHYRPLGDDATISQLCEVLPDHLALSHFRW